MSFLKIAEARAVKKIAAGVETPGWVDRLGVCDTSEHELEGGHRVYIGAHA